MIVFVSQYLTTLNKLKLFYKLLTYITTSHGDVLSSKAGHWGEKHSFGKQGSCRVWAMGPAGDGQWPLLFWVECQQSKFPNVLALSPAKLVPVSNAIAIWVGGSYTR